MSISKECETDVIEKKFMEELIKSQKDFMKDLEINIDLLAISNCAGCTKCTFNMHPDYIIDESRQYCLKSQIEKSRLFLQPAFLVLLYDNPDYDYSTYVITTNWIKTMYKDLTFFQALEIITNILQKSFDAKYAKVLPNI